MHSGLQRLPRRQTRAAEPAATIATIGLIVATIGDYRDYHDYRDYRTVATIAGGYRARRKSWRYSWGTSWRHGWQSRCRGAAPSVGVRIVLRNPHVVKKIAPSAAAQVSALCSLFFQDRYASRSISNCDFRDLLRTDIRYSRSGLDRFVHRTDHEKETVSGRNLFSGRVLRRSHSQG